MTFGFPAYHTEHFETKTEADLRHAVRAAFQSLAWKIKEETTQTMTATTTVGVRSYSEIVTVNFLSPQSVSVKSQCWLPTQCFDWGKNKENVTSFLAALSKQLN